MDNTRKVSITIRDITEQEKEAFIKCCAAYYGKGVSECLRDFIRAMPTFFSRDVQNMAMTMRISEWLQTKPEEIDQIIERQVPIYAALKPEEKYNTRMFYAIMKAEEVAKELQDRLNKDV